MSKKPGPRKTLRWPASPGVGCRGRVLDRSRSEPSGQKQVMVCSDFGRPSGVPLELDENTGLRFRSNQKRGPFQFKIGRPAVAGLDAEGETAGPAAQPAESPSAEHGIHKTVGATAPAPAFAVGKVPYPNRVEVDLVGGIEVRNRAPQIRRPRINCLIVIGNPGRGFEPIHAFGVGTGVDGLGVHVVEVELESRRSWRAAASPAARCNCCCAAGLPAVERRELVLIILIGSARDP